MKIICVHHRDVRDKFELITINDKTPKSGLKLFYSHKVSAAKGTVRISNSPLVIVFKFKQKKLLIPHFVQCVNMVYTITHAQQRFN